MSALLRELLVPECPLRLGFGSAADVGADDSAHTVVALRRIPRPGWVHNRWDT